MRCPLTDVNCVRDICEWWVDYNTPDHHFKGCCKRVEVEIKLSELYEKEASK